MNKLVVKIEKSGNRYNAFDFDGNKFTSDIGTGTRKKAYLSGMALEKRINKSGNPYWCKVSMGEFEKISVPIFDVSSNQQFTIQANVTNPMLLLFPRKCSDIK